MAHACEGGGERDVAGVSVSAPAAALAWSRGGGMSSVCVAWRLRGKREREASQLRLVASRVAGWVVFFFVGFGRQGWEVLRGKGESGDWEEYF